MIIPYSRRVVKAVIRAKDTGRYLLIKDTLPLMPGYSFPGGGVEKGEDLYTALMREMEEELGINDSVVTYTNTKKSMLSKHIFYILRVTQNTHIFTGEVANENITFTPNYEIAEVIWATEEKMLKTLNPHYIRLFEMLEQPSFQCDDLEN